MAGSRAGALIAGAWAAMMSIGENGYMKIVSKLMDTSKRIEAGIKKIKGLYVLGKPDMTVIAFGSTEVDIYKVNDVMTTQGWSLNALHKPSR
jgi:sphinganine-1-phosphate aldolase